MAGTSVNHAGATRSEAYLAELEAELTAGQVAFDSWASQRDDLITAIAAIKKLIGRQGVRQLPLPLPFGPNPKAEGVPEIQISPGSFRGLNYRAAVLRCFQYLGRPTTAPEIANMLHRAGYAQSRGTIKSNVDSKFRLLRVDGAIKKLEDGTYALS